MKNNLKINSDRLWLRLMEMAEIGKTEKGGCNRQTLTQLDKEGRDLFISWCKKIGCEIRIDQIGNIFAKFNGIDNNLSSVITGSHLDTQPTGGKFDGVFGVLAGLEVLETLHENKIKTKHPLEVVMWTNEEGSRFSPAMLGSGVWAGVFDLNYGHKRLDNKNISVKQALENINYLGKSEVKPFKIKASFEAHIEQGPILEKENKQIGVVTGVQGMRWYDCIIRGEPVHAGPTPMEMRNDPVKGLVKIIESLYKLAEKFSPLSRITFGNIKSIPSSYNTVPEQIILTIDLRHPEQNILDIMDNKLKTIIYKKINKLNLNYELKEIWNSPAIKFNQDCINAVENSVKELNYPYLKMVSGAGHDSVYISKVAPCSMIFVPCEKGISHNEAENTNPEDLAAGCNVLLNAILKMAN